MQAEPGHEKVRRRKIVALAIPAVIRKAIYLGRETECTVETTLGELLVVDSNVALAHVLRQDIAVTLANHGVTVICTD
jgi:hypothetical protein